MAEPPQGMLWKGRKPLLDHLTDYGLQKTDEIILGSLAFTLMKGGYIHVAEFLKCYSYVQLLNTHEITVGLD